MGLESWENHEIHCGSITMIYGGHTSPQSHVSPRAHIQRHLYSLKHLTGLKYTDKEIERKTKKEASGWHEHKQIGENITKNTKI